MHETKYVYFLFIYSSANEKSTPSFPAKDILKTIGKLQKFSASKILKKTWLAMDFD